MLTPVLAQSDDDGKVNVEGSAQEEYPTSYELASPDVTKPLTLQLEYHLYNPGEDVKVRGSVWSELVEKVDALNIIKIEAKDGQGNVVAREDAAVESDGKYGTSFALLDSAQEGTYTVEARIELEADALGIVNAITSAALQSSIEFAVAEPAEHKVIAENQDFAVIIASSSGINGFTFNQQDKKVTFFAEGNDGTAGITEITIPKALLSGEMTVLIDQNLATEGSVILKSNTEVESTFEINYKHSIHRVEVAGTNVIPEFPMALLIMAATIGSVIVVTVSKRRINF
ncbi:MAG TPA: MG2 domain-containing protein [Nitrososphaera sp.]|nr:MG2 domain-containing protein [Nitrososphaera sp.]